MVFFEYDASILPSITLFHYDSLSLPHKNIRRIANEYIFYLVTAGEMFICEDGRDYHLRQGDCFLFEPGKLHFGTQNSNYNIFYIHFKHPNMKKAVYEDRVWSEKARHENRLWLLSVDEQPQVSDKIIIPKYMHIADQLNFLNISYLFDKAIQRKNIHLENYNTLNACAVNEIFIECYRQFVSSSIKSSARKGERSHRISEVIAYLNANYQRKITSETIEKELLYNFDYLNQLFRQNLGTTVFKMLEAIRMENAKNLILTSNLSMEEISNEVGYFDEAYFSKVFKKNMGVAPTKYRKNFRV